MKLLVQNAVLIIILFSFTMCTGNKRKQFEYAGGSLVLSLENEPSSFIARNIVDFYSATLVNQVLEGIVRLDPKTLAPAPGLAKNWEVSADGLLITFTIRDDVYFHPHPDLEENRHLTIDDIIYNIEIACKKTEKGNPTVPYQLIFNNISGASEFHDGTTDNITGISSKDEYLIIELVSPEPSFIDKLAMVNAAITAPELIKNGKEGDLIGTGPFRLARISDEEGSTKIILTKNAYYYEMDKNGCALPYLDSVVFIVEEQSERRLELFEKGTTHMVYGLPPSKITVILDEKMDDFNKTPPKYELVRSPILATHYYQFNLLKDHFKDVRVRQAISYAIDREYIVKNILKNQAYGPGFGGMIPPDAFSGYDFDRIKNDAGYSYNPSKAKKLFAEAGYPMGEGFPTIDITFSIGSIHGQVADKIAEQLRTNLNIDCNLNGLTFEDKLNVQDYAKGDITAAGWTADYFSPENFLYNAYGKLVPADESSPSPINQPRYISAEFDQAFEAGQKATDIRDKYNHFVTADKILLRDAPFIYLWYDETIKVINSKVRNLNLNALNYNNYREVYFKEWTKEEYLGQKANEKV